MSGRDMLLFGASNTEHVEELMNWAEAAGVNNFMADYHRLQLENWLWSFRRDLKTMSLVLDVGVQNRRSWLGPGYKTFGFKHSDADVVGDLTDVQMDDCSVDAIICTEVLEHCVDPFAACREIHRILKPGGIALITSPFMWPWHGTREYRDYWRFTEDAWRLLLASFSQLKITACSWTDEGLASYEMMRRFECMGMRALTCATTGYLCEARK